MEPKNNKITISEETQIDVPPPRSLMFLEKRDWTRVRRMVSAIRTSHNRWENSAWFSASVVLTCFVTGLALKDDSQKIFIGISLASSIITVILFIASKAFSDVVSTSKDQVISEMAEIEEHTRTNQTLMSRNNTLEITKAVYGVGSKKIDVTEQVIKMINNNKLQFKVSNALGGDPNPGVVKELQLAYISHGKSFESIYKEGEDVNLT